MPLEGVSSSFFGITCWYRAVTPVTILGSTKCFTRPAENITALREVTKLSATHPGVFGHTVILKVANEHYHTCSTFANTLSKLSPASFLMSSSVHVGSSNKVANSCGYLETSSKPVGVLRKVQISNDGIIELIRLPYFFSTLFLKRNPIAFGIYVSKREYLINENEGNQSISEKQAKKHAKYRKNMQTKSRTGRDVGWMTLSIVGNACRYLQRHDVMEEGRSKKKAILLPGLVDYRNFVVKCSLASSNNTFVLLVFQYSQRYGISIISTLCRQASMINGEHLTLRIEFFFRRPVSFINIKFRHCKGCEIMVECRATPSTVIKRKLFWKHVCANAIENPIIFHGQFSLPDVETPGDDSASSSRTVENSIGFDNLASPRRRGKTCDIDQER
ncbi:hypothetical protein ALC53_01186 [Atta colombica]|uniref:Uncharacterized protein n=1 Tax=Atta colombica TaxID=520822 RepID=A0A195BVX2_9HYME|nr:hypothetical protein ALC53_01186 [Atta colombica]